MSSKEWESRIKSLDDKVFLKTYEELLPRVEYAKKHFEKTAIYNCLKKALDEYTPRYEELK